MYNVLVDTKRPPRLVDVLVDKTKLPFMLFGVPLDIVKLPPGLVDAHVPLDNKTPIMLI